MKTRFFLLILLLPILLCSCTGGEERIFAFAQSDAAFTLTFSSDHGEVTCDCVREGERVTLEITSPERSRGIVITTDRAGAIIGVGSASIPLSPEASRELTDLFDVMFRGDDGVTIRKTADGECTELVYEDGTVTVSKDGAPIEANVGRVVKISNYVTKK